MKNITKVIIVLMMISLLFIGHASAGMPHYINGTTYPMVWNGTYAAENINYMTYYTTGYDLFWNGGLIQTVWDGIYAYDMIAYPNNGTAISPWAFWHVESYNPINKKWGETIPVSNQFIKTDNSTLKRVMTMGSGENFNITYYNYGTRIKQDLELSNVLARQYRLTYRIDSVAAQDVNIDTKKFTPGFFNNFALFDVTDVLPYTVNATTGTYLYGWNTSATIDNTNRKMYFTLTNGQVMAAGQTVLIDPSWATNGSTTPAWQNTSSNNVSQINNAGNVVIFDVYSDFEANDSRYYTGIQSGTLDFGRYNGSAYSGTWKWKTGDDTTNYLASLREWVGVNITTKHSQLNISWWGNISTENVYDGGWLMAWNGTGYINVSGVVPVYTSSSAYFCYWGAVRTYPCWTGTTNNVWKQYTANLTQFIQPDGTVSVRFYFSSDSSGNSYGWIIDDVKIHSTNIFNGNLTAWHDSGSGNEVYQTEIQMYGNYSACTGSNATQICDQYYGTFNTTNSSTWNNQTLTITTKYQDYFVNLTLLGDTTTTPQTVNIGHWTQAVSAGNQPNITSWGNNYTNNNSLSFTVPQNTNVTFNSTANQTLTTCSWVGATQINCSADTYAYKLFDIAGTKYVNLSGSNANGSTLNTVNWTINVTSTVTTSSITIPANSWGMFNNWSKNTNFSSIAANESNDVAYTFYNVTSGEWDSYYIGYSWNAGYTIDKNNSVLGFFNAETTITATTVTPWNTTITEGWNMLYLMGTSNQTLTAICIDMVNCTDIYYYNSTTNDYVSTGTDTIQPNQGFLAYVNQTGTWIRSTI